MESYKFILWLIAGRTQRAADMRALCARVILAATSTADHDEESDCLRRIAIPFSQSHIEYAIRYQFHDRDLVAAISKAVINSHFSAVPCRYVTTNGEHDAILGLVNERPAMIVHAMTDGLTAIVGGFDAAAIIHDGALIKLSQDVASIQTATVVATDTHRRRHTPIAERAHESKLRKLAASIRQKKQISSWIDVPLPKLVVKLRGLLRDPDKESTLVPILCANPPARVNEFGLRASGRAAEIKMIEQMKAALGVNVLLTYYGLRNLKLTSQGAKDCIANEVVSSGVGVNTLLSLGRGNLSRLTGFDSEDELKKFSAVKYKTYADAGISGPKPDRISRIAAEIGNLDTLSRAIQKARAILRAFERSTEYSEKLAEIEIRQAYDVGGAFTDVEKIAIAMLLDVNPTSISKTTSISADEYEAFRFVGAIQRGAEAILAGRHLWIIADALTSDPNSRSTSKTIICNTISSVFTKAQFLTAITAAGGDDALRVTRRTREIGPAKCPMDDAKTLH